ncbi:hypothetical protein Kfla_7015 [Kribbella flavida DSM 17836]|uniref:Uncharacterized protein n=1 Tax=Kribbella flavida (strain DSM 17836 / JCM 10339 / NBRC 14399) TaxID=479435 RepID=D2Q3Y1_KRIFD|nr:hypothetical protein [Kribbella flavida]ADB36003.1 hypothetical protein Kfla_7015 [Kribbella flavida DSM 17836]
MDTRRILTVWVQAVASGVAGGTVLAALIALRAPLCPPDNEYCMADQWGVYVGLRAGLAVLLLAVPYFAWRARLAWPALIGSVGSAALLNFAWHYADRPGWGFYLTLAAAVLALLTLATASRRGQTTGPWSSNWPGSLTR